MPPTALTAACASSWEYGLRIELTEVNGQPGAAFYDPEGGLTSVFCLETADGVVQTIRGVINPAKLAHLGPLTRLRETRGWS